MLDDELENARKKVVNACGICTQTRMTVSSSKISIIRLNKAVNHSYQASFHVSYVGNKVYFVLDIDCAITGDGKRITVQNGNANRTVASFEQKWVYKHRVLNSSGAELELFNLQLTKPL